MLALRSALDFSQLFFQQLFVIQVTVVAVQGEKLIVRAQFDDASAVQHGDAIGVADGRNAMRNEDRGAPLHYVAQVVEDFIFRVSIDAGERIVEDEDSWIANQGAGDGGALLLPAGKRNSAFPHKRLIALGKAFNVGGDVGRIGRIVNLPVRGRVDSQSNIFADAVAEQKCFLRKEADIFSQSRKRIVANGPPIDEYHARLSVVNSRNEIDQRALAGTGGTDDSQTASGGNVQVQVV